MGKFLSKCLTSAGSSLKTARALRISMLYPIIKMAGDGPLENFYLSVREPKTTEKLFREPRTKEDEGLYGVRPIGYPEKTPVKLDDRVYSRSLSTRYSPDRPGVQAQRISDGVYKDPYTGKEYDWNNGFSTDSGEVFSGASVSDQTSLFRA